MDTAHLSEQAILALNFEYSTQILAALLPMALTVIFHGLGVGMVHRFFRRHGKPLVHGPHAAARTAVIIGIVEWWCCDHSEGAWFRSVNKLTGVVRFSFDSHQDAVAFWLAN